MRADNKLVGGLTAHGLVSLSIWCPPDDTLNVRYSGRHDRSGAVGHRQRLARADRPVRRKVVIMRHGPHRIGVMIPL